MNANEVISLTHQQCQALMPAYMNGVLAGGKSRAMQEHIAHCTVCFAELQELQTVRESMTEGDEELDELLTTTARKRNLEKVMARIENAEQAQGHNTTSSPEQALDTSPNSLAHYFSSQWVKVKQAWQITPDMARSLIVVQACALILFFSVSLSGPQTFENYDYQTLTDTTGTSAAIPSAIQAAKNGYHIYRVVFHPKTSEADVRNLLQGVEGQITGGPSLSGVYTLAVSGVNQQENILLSLRKSPWIEFAEPVIYSSGVASDQ